MNFFFSVHTHTQVLWEVSITLMITWYVIATKFKYVIFLGDN